MKSSDLLKSIKNADEKYIIESNSNNAEEFFEKKNTGNIISRIAAVAACVGLAAFIGVNVYLANAGRISGDTPGGKTLEDVTVTDKGKINLTVKTYKRSIADIKTEKTIDIVEQSVKGLELKDKNIGALSYVSGETEKLYKAEKTYIMDKTDAIVKYAGNKKEWTYRIDEGANFYASQSVSGGVVYMKTDGEAGFINENGKLKWKTKLDILTTDIYEYDNKIYFIGCLIQEIVCEQENSDIIYSPVQIIINAVSKDDGNIISTVSDTVGIYGCGLGGGVTCIGVTDDGIIIKSHTNYSIDVLTVLGFDGKVKFIISFENKDNFMRITDADIFDGNLYLSGTFCGINDTELLTYINSETTQFSYFVSKCGYDYYNNVFDGSRQDYDNSQFYNRSFMLIYSLDKEEPYKLYTSDYSYGGRIYKEFGVLKWDTIAPVKIRIKNDIAIYSSIKSGVSLEGYASTVNFDSEGSAQNITEGDIYAMINYPAPVYKEQNNSLY